MHPGYLSNAYVIADEEGGTAVFVDSGAPMEPLLAAVERWGATPVAVLRTHAHGDHVEHEDELGVQVVMGDFEAGGLRVEALPTPGHSDDGLSFVVNDELCFSGDTLFKDAVGGTRDDFAAVKQSVMDVLMALPPETRVLPGHTDETTIGREWEENPFVRVWRGVDPEGTEAVRVAGEDGDPDRLVAGLRRQGQGLGALRGRPRRDRRRLARRAALARKGHFRGSEVYATVVSVTVGIRKFRENLRFYLDLVKDGTNAVVITERGKPIARLQGPSNREQLIAEGRLIPARKPKRPIRLEELIPVDGPPWPSEQLIADRKQRDY